MAQIERGDEQEPNVRCATPGTSGHVTAKPITSVKLVADFAASPVTVLSSVAVGIKTLHDHRKSLEVEQSSLREGR